MTVVIVDPGSGNLNSVARALRRAAEMAGLTPRIVVTRDARSVRDAERIVLPGQGAFAACRAGIAALPGMMEALEEASQRQAKPFMGICVGMQLLAERGLEHAETPGFAWLPGEVAPMAGIDATGHALPLPQMGWNRLRLTGVHPVFAGLSAEAHGYFVHSYSWTRGLPSDILATTDYGMPVTAAVGRANVVGTQFHVEKSGLTGLTILRNFLAWAP